MIHENERRAPRYLVVLAFIFVALAVLVFSMALGAVYARAAHAHPSEQVPAPVTTTVTVADLAPLPLAVATSTAAQPGEGVIRITTRVCGNANNWPSVAAANGIVASSSPPYLVLLGQVLSVSCVGGGSAPAPQQAPAPVQSSGGWTQPVCGLIGDGIGAGRNHKGVDLSVPYGREIHAAAAGTVSVGWEGGAGNYTVIDHGGIWTIYMHQSRFAVRSGWVNKGQIIGYVGSTGNSTGPHLHFEVRTGWAWGTVVDPISFMANHGARLSC
jgi:murein DD-endopeptidase MepM/ murein hydrolase activator NlpD